MGGSDGGMDMGLSGVASATHPVDPRRDEEPELGSEGPAASDALAPLRGPTEEPPAAIRRRGWRKWWAMAGVAGGFLSLVLPGFFALRSYVKWEKGEKRRPLFAWVWACVFAALATLSVAGTIIDSPHPQSQVHDDFSNPSSGWAVGDSSLATVGYVDGTYRILVKNQADTEDSLLFVSKSSRAITAQADMRKAAAAGPEMGMAVECLVRRGTVYAFAIDPDAGEYAIVRMSDDRPTNLQDGFSSAIKAGGSSNQVRGDCVGDGGSGPTRLVLSINGQRVYQITDPHGLGSFKGMGLGAASFDQGGAEARFDNALEAPLPSGG